MHTYQCYTGRLPPAALYGKEGKPLLSWRVLILPYIEEYPLFQQFKLDEPWDSTHNIKLLEKMPRSYAPPERRAGDIPRHHTICHVFVGKGTAFEGTEGLKLKEDFPDGTSNTLLIVEAGKPVPWTKPENLSYDPAGPLPDMTGLWPDMIRVVMTDAVNRRVSTPISDATLRAVITRNAGDRPGKDW